jgi:glycine cleavage system H protein
MGEIESVKAVSDLNSPVGGRVLERNDKLTDNPENVNEEPYESGWMLKVALGDTEDLDKLMTAEQYKAFLASQE